MAESKWKKGGAVVVGDAEEAAGGLVTWHVEEVANTNPCAQTHNLMSFESEGFDNSVVSKLNKVSLKNYFLMS